VSESLVTAWQSARRALEAAGVEEPTVDARLLVEAGAGVRRQDILTEPRRVLSDAQVLAIAELVARRVQREPMSHILGVRGFRDLLLRVNADVLTPRPETEFVVEAALGAIAADAPARVLDLGVGSGAILAAILSERPRATGVGVDASQAALAVARDNFAALGLDDRAQLRLGRWGEGLDAPFDVIVSNPPYIPSADIAALAPEVSRYEPHLALDGGEDGLAAYRALLSDIARLLAPEGIAVLEFGVAQADAIATLLKDHGLRPEQMIRDLSGHPRVWTARR
jgi:release factor glutamine methyltransferase